MAYNVEAAEVDALGRATLAPVAEGEAAKKIEGRSPWLLAWQRLRHDRAAMISLAVIIVIVLVAIFAPVLAAITGHGVYQQFRGPQPPIGLSVTGQPVGPSSAFLLGTDDQGRDILVRIAYGARISLFVGVVATAVVVLGGLVIGLAAGFFGGWVDSILARFMDWILAVPFLLFALSLASVVQIHPIGPIGPGLPVVIVVLGVLAWGSVGRIVRGQVLSIREKEYIEAVTIVGEASLSFLGVGVQAPTADWGEMISAASSLYLYGPWWYLLFPSLALLITTLAFNIFGDGVRDAFDPRGTLYV
jgi:ABC-type dipeptide/oligopeptide/nickel transport system permease subunit